jgi:hypothetical protein
MGSLVRCLLAVSTFWLCASPAEAKLDAPIATFTRSKLIQGDSLFHFEGRFGARYRFAGARHCRFGQGLLAVDVDDQRIVQQTLVMPLPTTTAEEKTLREVVALFVDDLGLDVTDRERAQLLDAFSDTLLGGKKVNQPLGKTYELRIVAQPQLRTILLAVGLKGIQKDEK